MAVKQHTKCPSCGNFMYAVSRQPIQRKEFREYRWNRVANVCESCKTVYAVEGYKVVSE